MKLNLQNNSIINLFRYTWKYSKGRRHLVVIFIIFAMMASGIWLIEPIIIGRIFNSIQFSNNDPQLLNYIFINLGFLILVSLGFWIFNFISRLMEEKNSFFVRKNYRQDMFDKVMDLPVEWHIDHHSGDTIDKIEKASDNLYHYSSEMFIIFRNIVRLVGSVFILAFFDFRSSLIALCITGIAIFIIAKFDVILKKKYDELFKYENKLASAIHDYISNVITVITLKLKKRASKEINDRDIEDLPVFFKGYIIDETKWAITGLLITLMLCFVLAFNAYTSYTTNGVIVISSLFILYKYLHNIGTTFYEFAYKYGEILRQDTAVKAAEVINQDYNELVSEKKKKDKVLKKKKGHLYEKWKTLQVKDLSFSYKLADIKFKRAKHIDKASFTIGNRERIAFIGASGSGKSTVLALMRGLFEPEKSVVYSDGRKVKNGIECIYDKITLIPQEPEIFNTTIRDNITMGLAGGKKKLEEVIKLAQFTSVIPRLENGLETNVMEKGISLSGGEKQRLALARGLFASDGSDFLLLDEPTSSVDSANELKIYRNIFNRYKKKTIISSIHRLHLLQFFDYIYYFKNGKIITEGTLITLLEDEDFKVLWRAYKSAGNI